MFLLKHKIPFVVCLIFVISSPITQIFGSYVGGYLAHLVSFNDSNTDDVVRPLMAIMILLSVIGFIYSKSKPLKVISSILVTLFIGNLIVFSDFDFNNNDFFVYPGQYILGSMFSFIILFVISEVKEKHF